MKRKLFFGLFIMAFLFSAQAQPIPVGNNSGFETWSGTPSEATGWTTALKAKVVVVPVVGVFDATGEFGKRTNDAHEGVAALKVSPVKAIEILPAELQAIANTLLPTLMPGMNLNDIVVPGICQLGVTSRTTVNVGDILALAQLDFSNIMENIPAFLEQLSVFEGFMAPGVAFEGAPETVKAQVKLTSISERDTAIIIAFSTRANGDDRDYIAMGMTMINNISNEYAEVSIDMNNIPNAKGEADNLSIVIVCGALGAQTSTALYVDKVMAEGQLEVIPDDTISVADRVALSYTMSPNPANDVVKVTPSNTTENYTVNVYDITGKLVIAQTNLMGETVINTSKLTSGIYMLEMRQGKNSRTSKLVIE